MAASWMFKVIVIGSTGVGKTAFTYGSPIPLNRYSVGVNIKSIVSSFENGDSCKTILWDIEAKRRVVFIYPSFLRGAAGCLLCFNLHDHHSFEDLDSWIRLVRKVRGCIPVFLIGTKSDLEPQVSDEEIQEFVEQYSIDGYFHTSLEMPIKRNFIVKQLASLIIDERIEGCASGLRHNPDLDENLYELLERVREMTRPEGGTDPILQYSSLPPKMKQAFNKFLKFFSRCPICHNQNHESSLSHFFFSTDPNIVKFRERLLKLMEEAEEFDEIYYNKIKLGIPCCNCFRLIFN